MKKGLLIKLITRNLLLVACFSLLVTVLLAGCGGAGPGAPGSSGSEDTGVLIGVVAVTPTYNGKNTYSVDVVQQICDAGPPPVYEYFADHSATVTINVSLLNPNTTGIGIPVGVLYVEKYTVEYFRSTDSIGSPPIETDTRYKTVEILPPTGGGTYTMSFDVILVDLTRKNKYYTNILSGVYTSRILNNYTAVYTFSGKNQYGSKFSFKGQVDFQIGSFNNC